MKELIGALFILAGVIMFFVSVLGIYRLKYALNRIHAASVGDTLGLGLIVVGLMFMSKDIFVCLKLFLVLLFLWLSSPIATHMIAKVEVLTKENSKERTHKK